LHVTICVVGAGVIGLTTALELEAAGHTVELVAEHTLEQTTSAVAGAVWFPYQVGPPDRVPTWAARTRARLLSIADEFPEAGVDILDGYECASDDAPPWWAASVEVRTVTAPVAAAPEAWHFLAPRAQPSLFLPWLMSRIRAPITRRRITAWQDLDAARIINCTGLGARELTGDRKLVAMRGQVAIAEPGSIPAGTSFTDDRGPDPLFYAIPRRGQVVLGGTCELVDNHDPCIPDPAVRERILTQCRNLGWEPGAVIRDRVGLRPYRPSVRLEFDDTDPRVLHNYGHGGAGFTLCFGCAEEVVELCAQRPNGT
jgi:D-amino-acid oxidase